MKPASAARPEPAEAIAPAAAERDAALARAGWQRRFVASPPELGEIVELYSGSGHDVHLEPTLASDLPPACGGCALATTFFRIIYIRPHPADGDEPHAYAPPCTRGQP